MTGPAALRGLSQRCSLQPHWQRVPRTCNGSSNRAPWRAPLGRRLCTYSTAPPSASWDGLGWSPGQMERFMSHGRDWQAVEAFYRQLVAGRACLSDIGLQSAGEWSLGADWQQQQVHALAAEQAEGGTLAEADHQHEYTAQKGERWTHKVLLSYFGPSFEASSHNPVLQRTVEGVLTPALKPLAGRLPKVSAAGRTDKGVTAAAQAVSFVTYKPAQPGQILRTINAIAPGELRAWHATQVPRSFHATFAARARRYVYLLPLRPPADQVLAGNGMGDQAPAVDSTDAHEGTAAQLDNFAAMDELDVDPERVAAVLASLEGQALDYYAFGRDTPTGKDCTCALKVAKAQAVALPSVGGAPATPALCIELVGNRFLRRMVRVLVSTVLRESVNLYQHDAVCSNGGSSSRLVDLCAAKDRKATALPAPSLGLCFAGAEYDLSNL